MTSRKKVGRAGPANDAGVEDAWGIEGGESDAEEMEGVGKAWLEGKQQYFNPDVGCAPHGAKRPCRMCARNEASKRSRAGRRQRAAGQGPVTGNKPAGRPLGMPRSEPDLRELAKALFGEDPMLAVSKPTLDPGAFHDPILGEMAVMQMIESELWRLKKQLGLPAGDRRAGRVC